MTADAPKEKEFAKPLSLHLTRFNVTRDGTPNLPATMDEAKSLSCERFRQPPATNAEILRHLADLDVVYPSPQMTTQEKSRRYQLFCAELRMYPEPVIAAAKRAYMRDPASVFYPSPGQLVGLCEAESVLHERKPPVARAAPAVIEPHPNLGKPPNPALQEDLDRAKERLLDHTRDIAAKTRASLATRDPTDEDRAILDAAKRRHA